MRHEKKTITEKKGKNPTTQSKQKEIIYKTMQNIKTITMTKFICLRSYKHVQYHKDHWWEKNQEEENDTELYHNRKTNLLVKKKAAKIKSKLTINASRK